MSYPKAKDFTANMQDKWDYLPGMKRWDGIPNYEFVTVWIAALMVALGAVVQGGNTLLQCAEGTDAGRDPSDSPEDQRDHLNRKARLYASIMNYIDPTSRIHRTASKDFPNDGPGLYKWLKVVGELELDQETKEEWLRNFDRATMAKVGIPFTPEGIFKWLDWVEEYGAKSNKSPNQKRKKFLEGFPASFDVVITAERMVPDPGSYKLPANFPPHHPKAGTADPDAGKPDLEALARALYPEWSRRIKSGMIKAVPKGMVYMADDGSHDEDDSNDDSDNDLSNDMSAMAVSRGKVNAMMVCLACGGLGHAANVEGMQCLTTQLGVKVPKHDLAKIKYPNGIKFPEWSRRSNPKRRDSNPEASYTDKQRLQPKPRAKPKLSEKDKRKLRKQREAKEAREAEVEKSDSQSSSESEQELAPESKFASVYSTIDVRSHPNKGYRSYSSSSSDDAPEIKMVSLMNGPRNRDSCAYCRDCNVVRCLACMGVKCHACGRNTCECDNFIVCQHIFEACPVCDGGYCPLCGYIISCDCGYVTATNQTKQTPKSQKSATTKAGPP
jgi:hypothetical protein